MLLAECPAEPKAFTLKKLECSKQAPPKKRKKEQPEICRVFQYLFERNWHDGIYSKVTMSKIYLS